MNASTYLVEVSAEIPAPAAEVYALLRNYHPDGHPSILPRRYFTDLRIVQGGVGAGTVIDVDMQAGGSKTTMRLEVSEPEPGRLLVEQDPTQGLVTHFALEEATGGHCRLTLRTWFPRKSGIRGWIEKLLVPGMTRKIYKAELVLIQERFAGR